MNSSRNKRKQMNIDFEFIPPRKKMSKFQPKSNIDQIMFYNNISKDVLRFRIQKKTFRFCFYFL